MKIRTNPARKAFNIFNVIFCILVGILCICPVVHILAVSFSSIDPVRSNRVTFWPVGFNTDNYYIVVRDAQFTDAELDRVLWRNAAELFGLTV